MLVNLDSRSNDRELMRFDPAERVQNATVRRSALYYQLFMPMFLVTIHRSGPDWDSLLPMEEQSGWAEHAAFMDGLVDDGFIVLGGPLSDGIRVAHAVEAESEEDVRTTLSRDPWSETHLHVTSVEPWEIRLDGRSA